MDASTPVWNAARTLLGEREADFFRRWKRVLKTWDLEDIHDLRVASRRLREGLTLFSPLYGPSDLSTVLKVIKKVTSALGPLRNTDEALLYFGTLSDRLPPACREELRLLMDNLAALRLQEQDQLHRHLEALSHRGLRKTLRRTVSRPRLFTAPLPVDPWAPFVLYARAAERERFSPLPQLLSEAVMAENKEAQHRLRIAVKRYRYRLELLSPLLGDRFPGLHAAIRRYQEVLGTMHDLDVFCTMISDGPISDSARGSIIPQMSRERDGRYNEFLAMHEDCSLLTLGGRVENLL
jgi:CHAD domain-containing protein